VSKISEYLNKIKTAIYGREVRDAIHDSIKECYADVTSGATLANAASDKANAATEKANTAASNADTATASANSAANLANTAASNADNKAALADEATANANAATESANAAASSAADKAALADTAATGATAAMNSANEAASNANGKATLADEATANANAATESANAAASNADGKAALADRATTDANNAANLANTAATTADDKAALADNAAGLIRRMDVSTTHLPPGSAPTSSLNTVEDASGLSHYSLVLGIPTGNTGATPALTFEVSTGAAGTSATVEVTGTAEAPIVHLTIPKGDTGKIENLVINGKPVDNGTITLTASDIGALPAETAIPTKTSDLTNDSGFVTVDNAPVQSVNGKTGVVSLSAEDIGALSGTDATLAITGEAADAKATGDLINQLKADVDTKIDQSDALTLEEIMASTDLSKKVANAEAVKSIKNAIGSIKSGSFYTEKSKGNTVPADYGGFIRLSGNSWPGSFSGDTYYIGVASNSTAYMGIQINKATQVTWVKI
jgi:hypothetical protein